MPNSEELHSQAYEEALDALEHGRGLAADQVLHVATTLFLHPQPPPKSLISRALAALENRSDLGTSINEFAEALRQRLTPKTPGIALSLLVPQLVYWDLALALGHRAPHAPEPLPEHATHAEREPFTVKLGASSITIAWDERPGAPSPNTLVLGTLNLGPRPLGNWIANALPLGADLRTEPNAHAGPDPASALAALIRVLPGRLIPR